jgi:hypothetical protein
MPHRPPTVAFMEIYGVAAAVLHRRAEGVEPHGSFGLEVVEDRAAFEIIADSLGNVVH